MRMKKDMAGAAIVLGLALGLGLLAKYMMGCFILGIAVADTPPR